MDRVHGRAVQRGGGLGRGLVDPPDDLRHGLRRPVDPAGVDALGRESEVEVAAGHQPRLPLEHGQELLAGGARIRRRLEHHEMAATQPPADLGAGVEDDREVRLALLRERRRERDQDRVDIAEDVVVGRGAEPARLPGAPPASPRRRPRCSSRRGGAARRAARRCRRGRRAARPRRTPARAGRRRSLRRRSPPRTWPSPAEVSGAVVSGVVTARNATRAVGRDRRPAHGGNRLDNPAGRRDTRAVESPSVVGETVCARCGRSSPADASFCASCGARLGPVAAPQEERKLVSILFVDLEGFTASSEAADPEDVRDALARYHTSPASESRPTAARSRSSSATR